MRIVEQTVSAGGAIFDLGEFLSRPLFAHLAHASEHGPRESPVWFHWDGAALWIVGGESFPGVFVEQHSALWMTAVQPIGRAALRVGADYVSAQFKAQAEGGFFRAHFAGEDVFARRFTGGGRRR